MFENPQKFSFNIASEAGYVYILSGQKFIKNAKNSPFWRVFEKTETGSQTVLPDRALFYWTKIGRKCQNQKYQMRHFEKYSNTVQ